MIISASLFSGCSLFTANKAGLQVITNDVAADIYLDGKKQGSSPYIGQDLKPGEYTLELKPIDATLTSYQTKVTLRKQLLTVLTWRPGDRPETSGGVLMEMDPLRNKNNAELSVITIPDGAIITLDDEAKGFAPVLVENIEPGDHQLEVRLPSYDSQVHTITVQQGYRMNVTVKLSKQQVASPTGELSGLIASSSTSLSASKSATLSGTASGSAKKTVASPSPAPKVSPSPKAATSSAAKQGTTVRIKPTGYKENGVEGLRVRTGSGPDYDQLGFAPTGSTYPYLNKEFDGWYQVNFEGKTGWISSAYAELIP